MTVVLPRSMRVFERGWLSANNILFLEGERAALVDSGYVAHADQTVALLRHGLDGRALTRLVNTHGHSDHIGGNARVAAEFGCAILVPEGYRQVVADWDEERLLLRPTGQRAPRFCAADSIAPGTEIELGGLVWKALAAPGHDMDALVFHCEAQRILISGDALWRDGFGILFDEVLGRADALAAARATLEMIGRLEVDTVIPGHGAPFVDVDDALRRAENRADAFAQAGERMAKNALRALFVFSMLERRTMPLADLPRHLAEVPIYRSLNDRYFRRSCEDLAWWLVQDLVRAGALVADEALLSVRDV